MSTSIEARRLALTVSMAVMIAAFALASCTRPTFARAAPEGATVAGDKYHLLMHPAGEDPASRPAEDKASYYEDGLIEAGPYAGYRRLIVERPGVEADGPDYFTVATRNEKTFILDKARAGSRIDAGQFNTVKVTGVADLPKALPRAADLGANFGLDFLGDFSDHKANGETLLTSRRAGLSFLSDPLSPNFADWKSWLSSDTTVRLRDAAGNSFRYHLTFPAITSGGDTRLYNAYGNLFGDQLCSKDGLGVPDSFVVTATVAQDLVDLHRQSNGMELFAFAHPETQPLVRAVYQQRRDTADASDKAPPPLSDYVKKAPVLLFRDPWSRWIAVAEQDHAAPGGCGAAGLASYEG